MVLRLASHEQAGSDKLDPVLLVTADDEVRQAADAIEQAEPAIVLKPMLGLVVTVALMVSASALPGTYLLIDALSFLIEFISRFTNGLDSLHGSSQTRDVSHRGRRGGVR
jgi:hypothetical protein